MENSLTFKLSCFEGPMDLLLFLISKHKLNINDIEIAVLLEQYLLYIEDLSETDFETAGEFLEMAAKLIYIKTVSLLPKPEEAIELKKELEGKLIEYSLCKACAQKLGMSYVGGDSFVREPMEIEVDKTYNVIHTPDVLLKAYLAISNKAKRAAPLKASVFEPIVSHRIVSVTSKIIFILKNLYTAGTCPMDKLYDGVTDKSERVATFLAVLELTKSGRIRISDDNSELYFVNNKGRQRGSARQPQTEKTPDEQDDSSDATADTEDLSDVQPIVSDADESLPMQESEDIPSAHKAGASLKVNLWNNPGAMRHYHIATGALRKANLWGYVKKGSNICR